MCVCICVWAGVWTSVCACVCVWAKSYPFAIFVVLATNLTHIAFCMHVGVCLSLSLFRSCSLSLYLSHSAPSTIKLFVVCTLSKMLAGCLRFMLLGFWDGQGGEEVGSVTGAWAKVVYFSCKLHES